MNIGIRCFVLAVLAWTTEGMSYSLPYEAHGACRNNSNEYLKDNLCCSKCSPGTRKLRDCTSVEDTVCEPCPDGRFSESMNYYPNCFLCNKCPEEKNMVYTKQCSSDSNAVCGCKPGWFCTRSERDSCDFCLKHTTCGPGKGAKSAGTSTKNVKCEPCPAGKFSNETSTQLCQPHTRCDLQGRSVLKQGTATADTVCGPILSTTPQPLTFINLHTIMAKTSSSPTEPSTKPPVVVPQYTSQGISSTSQRIFSEISSRLDDFPPALWIGLTVVALLLVLLIAGFCICHRKAAVKPAVHDAVEAGQCSTSVHFSSPTEKHGLLADSSSDPSTSSSSDSHSQGTGVSQDCLHVEQPSVSSPVLNVSITATINCQVNPGVGACSIPVSPCVHLLEPEYPLSQEEELCVSCEQEDCKDLAQSVQESGMTKY